MILTRLHPDNSIPSKHTHTSYKNYLIKATTIVYVISTYALFVILTRSQHKRIDSVIEFFRPTKSSKMCPLSNYTKRGEIETSFFNQLQKGGIDFIRYDIFYL